MKRLNFFLITLLVCAFCSQTLTATNPVNATIEVIEDDQLGDNEVIVYAARNFYGKSVKLELGTFTAEELKERKVYVIRSMKVAPATKVYIFYNNKTKETVYSTKKKMTTYDYTKVQVAKFGDFSKEPKKEELEFEPVINSESKAVLYNTINKKSVQITPGKIDNDKLARKDVKFFKKYAIASGYEMKAFTLSGFRGTSYVVRGKGTLDRLCMSLVLRKIDNSNADEVLPTKEAKAFVRYDITGVGVNITPGSFDHDRLKAKGLRFIQSYDIAPGYELIAYSLKGFKGPEQRVTGKGKLDKLAMSIILRPIQGSTSSDRPSKIPNSSPIENETSDVYAVLRYDITGAQVKIRPGNYDHDQLKSKGVRFVQTVNIPVGYELWAYPFKGFKGDPVIIKGSGKLKKMAMSVKLKKR